MTENENKKSLFKEILGFAETLIVTLFCVSLIFTYLLSIVTVDGDSMEENLFSDERVLVSQVSRHPEAGDIVVAYAAYVNVFNDDGIMFRHTGLQKKIIKRVIAVGGQTIDIDFKRGEVFVDGEKLKEDYVTLGLTHNDDGAFSGKYPLTIPEGYYFVMGDNRPVSRDSRSSYLGLVSQDEIMGKVLFRISPVNKIGSVD